MITQNLLWACVTVIHSGPTPRRSAWEIMEETWPASPRYACGILRLLFSFLGAAGETHQLPAQTFCHQSSHRLRAGKA